jgi:glyceraldehyde-3-phosphate dehydrogenase (NAD(P))
MVRVAINGYGTIGKRLADAVKAQDDMEIVGVVKTSPSFELYHAQQLGFPIYANNQENVETFKAAGILVEGTVEDLLDKADIVFDCTPNKMGAANVEKLYKPRNVKAILQGGEKAHTVEVSFNASQNFEQAIGKNIVRVVSCNTTGLSRSLGAINNAIGIEKVRATMIRRGADPMDHKKGPINSITPNPVTIPSHHGPDVQTIIPGLNIVTTAVIVPTTLMHMHTINIMLKRQSTTKEVLQVLRATPRVLLVKADKRVASTANIMEMARDLGRKRSDLQELVIWEESVNVINGTELFFMQAVHQESIVVPDNIDCVRAMMGLTQDNKVSMQKTDASLGLTKWW